MNRRDLIQDAARLLGTSALSRVIRPGHAIASAAGVDVAPAVQTAEIGGDGRRQAPAKPVVLRTRDLKVTFDPKDGLPYSYEFMAQRLWGEDEGQPVRAVVCRLEPREYRTVPAQVRLARLEGNAFVCDYSVALGGKSAASFRLRYVAAGSTLIATLESVRELPGTELIEVEVPRLMSVHEEDGPAWMSEGRRGGSFVRLEAAKAFRFPDNEYFGRISTELPVGLVGTSQIGCLMEVTAYHDGTETQISGAPGRHRATLGCIMTHRVHGGRCYNMNDGGSAVCGNASTLNLPIGQMPRTRFDFFTCSGQDHPWLTGAKIMRSRMPPAPTQYFSDRFLYILAGKRKIDAEPKSTFAQSKQIVHDIAMLTDGAPQVAFISGFAYDGQDTGFPSEDKINESLGTDADLLELIRTAPAVNANVTLNVNYDDAYKSSPVFDEAFIAKRPDGKIWKSRAWDGEDSYVVGMAKYMNKGFGSKRIAFTTGHFKIKDALLIDAMSWFAVRNDWDPQSPASGYKNLIDGKYRIIEEFRQRGVAVTSEQLRYPFIGKLAESMDGPGVSNCPFGGEAVPLLSTIYRGSAIWGGESGGSIRPGRELFWNTRSALWFQADTDRTKMTDFYYLVVLPFSKLHRLAVEGYESKGPVKRVVLEQRSHVELNVADQGYSAVLNGVEIAKSDATFCPIDDHRIAFYSRTSRTLQYPAPTAWRPDEVTARTLSASRRVPCRVTLQGGMITVDVQPKQPVVVYASAAQEALYARVAAPLK